MGRDFKLQVNYWLSCGEYYFRYRTDKYNKETIRAELYYESGELIETRLVKGGFCNLNLSHNDIINIFEVSIDELSNTPKEKQ